MAGASRRHQSHLGPSPSTCTTHRAPEAYVTAQVEMGRPAPANPNPLDFDLDKRRKWMDEHGIECTSGRCRARALEWATAVQGAARANHERRRHSGSHGLPRPLRRRHRHPRPRPRARPEGIEPRGGQAGHACGPPAELHRAARLLVRARLRADLRALPRTGLPAAVPSARRRGEHLQQEDPWAACPHQLARLHIRKRDDGREIHHDRHAGQVSETGHRLTARRRLVPLHCRSHRTRPL